MSNSLRFLIYTACAVAVGSSVSNPGLCLAEDMEPTASTSSLALPAQSAEEYHAQASTSLKAYNSGLSEKEKIQGLKEALTLNQKGLDIVADDAIRDRLDGQRSFLLIRLVSLGEDSYYPELEELLRKRMQHSNPSIASQAKSNWQIMATSRLGHLDAEKKAESIEHIISVILEGEPNVKMVGHAYTFAHAVQPFVEYEKAADINQLFADHFSKSQNEKVLDRAIFFEGAAHRLRGLGQPIDVKGRTAAGEDFDLKALRGKVVLLDFWATTCIPCIAEFPKLRHLKDVLQPHGFEIVGICMDGNKERLHQILEHSKVSWITLFDEDVKGFRHPIAVKYGISKAPSLILLDADGNILMEGKKDEIYARIYELFPSVQASTFSYESSREETTEASNMVMASLKKEQAEKNKPADLQVKAPMKTPPHQGTDSPEKGFTAKELYAKASQAQFSGLNQRVLPGNEELQAYVDTLSSEQQDEFFTAKLIEARTLNRLALELNPEAELRKDVLNMQRMLLEKLYERDTPGAFDELKQLHNLAEQDESPAIRKAVPSWKVSKGLTMLRKASPEEQDAVLAPITEMLLGSDPNDEELLVTSSIYVINIRKYAGEEKFNEVNQVLSEHFQKPVEKAFSERLKAIKRQHSIVHTLPGKPLEVSGKTVSGEDFNLEDLKGKVVLVDFWATWCVPCRAEFPNMRKLHEAYQQYGFEIVGISIDEDRDRLLSFLEESDLPWIVLHDTEHERNPIAVKYGISSIPRMILVDSTGKVISVEARGKELLRLLAERYPEVEPPIAIEEETDKQDQVPEEEAGVES